MPSFSDLAFLVQFSLGRTHPCIQLTLEVVKPKSSNTTFQFYNFWGPFSDNELWWGIVEALFMSIALVNTTGVAELS